MGDLIPWWYFDELGSIWVQEGEARVYRADDGLLWTRARPTHFTWWNADQPFESHACIKLRLRRAGDDLPLSGLEIKADGVTYAGSHYACANLEDTYQFTVKRSSAAVTERVRLRARLDSEGYWVRELADGSLDLTTVEAEAWEITSPLENASCITGENLENCRDLGDRSIDLNRAPVIHIDGDPRSICAQSVEATARVADPEGDSVSLEWSALDGGSFEGDVTSSIVRWIPPESTGTYRLLVVATDLHGARSQRVLPVPVTTNCCPQVEELSLPTSVDPHETQLLRLRAEVDDPDHELRALAIRWIVDGVELESRGAEVDWRVRGVGLLPVVVAVSDGECEVRQQTMLRVENAAPSIMDVEVDSRLLGCAEREGRGSISVEASDPDSDDVSYHWSATRGTLRGEGASVEWEATGGATTAIVSIEVRDGHGGTDRESVRVHVVNRAPLVDLEIVSGSLGDPEVVVQARALDPEGGQLEFEWVAVDGSISGEGERVTWSLGDNEYQSIDVTVRDACGAVATLRRTLGPSDQEFLRGDANLNGTLDLSDAVLILQRVAERAGEIELPATLTELGEWCEDVPESADPLAFECPDAADFNDDGRIDCSDAVGMHQYLFEGGAGPSGEYEIDSTLDFLGCGSNDLAN